MSKGETTAKDSSWKNNSLLVTRVKRKRDGAKCFLLTGSQASLVPIPSRFSPQTLSLSLTGSAKDLVRQDCSLFLERILVFRSTGNVIYRIDILILSITVIIQNRNESSHIYIGTLDYGNPWPRLHGSMVLLKSFLLPVSVSVELPRYRQPATRLQKPFS